MSINTISTNFTGLIEPRVINSTLFSTSATFGTGSGSTATVSLQGYVEAGVCFNSISLVAPPGATGILASTTFTITAVGKNTPYAELCTFLGSVLQYTGSEYQPLQQDSYITISAKTAIGTVTPSVLITYLS